MGTRCALKMSATTPARLRIAGESAAGSGWHHEMKAGEAVRIMTGAPVPAGADAVQQVELTREADDAKFVEILQSVEVGRSIVRRAAEIKAGETVLRAGEDINAAMIATLASFGYAQVKVGRRPRVAIMATGSELVDIDQKPGKDQIRDSNNYTLAAYATLAGANVERLPLAGDDPEELKRQMSAAVERSDVLITSGGVSMGVYDFTKAALKELGAEIFSSASRCDQVSRPSLLGSATRSCLGFPAIPFQLLSPSICSRARRCVRCRARNSRN